MNFQFLGEKIVRALNCVKNLDKLYEIRLRAGFGVRIVYGFDKYYLSEHGIAEFENNSIKVSNKDIEDVINRLTERSFYAFNDKIKQGYLFANGGIRVGLCGECVFEKEIVTVKNITSLNVRIPHEILGCSNSCYPYMISFENVYNSLIVSPPFCGKTTILKDFVRRINIEKSLNVLLVDERGEFSNIQGANIDSVRFSDKFYAFSSAIRTMSPDVIVTDELCSASDWSSVERAVNSGVKVIASCHADNLCNLTRKEYFKKGLFDKYIFLESNKNLIGKVKNVYDYNLVLIK